MLHSNLDSYLRSVRCAPILTCPPSIYSDLQNVEESSSLSLPLLHFLSYSLSRFNLFRSTGCVSLAAALAPAAPCEHYAYPCFVPLLQFLGYEPKDCNVPADPQKSVHDQDKGTCTLPLESLICAQTVTGAQPLFNNMQGIPPSASESDTTSDSEELSTNQQPASKSRPKTHAELHLRHLRRSIPRLRPTKYANLYLLQAPSRPAVCPNIILIENNWSSGLATLFRSVCYRVSDVHSNPPANNIFSTVYSTVIGEKQRSTMAHRNLQMHCCHDSLGSDFAHERILSTVQESKRILRLFTRREQQKDGTWGKRTRRSHASSSGSITQALIRAKAAIQQNTKSDEPYSGSMGHLVSNITETQSEDKEICQRSSPSPSESSLSVQTRDNIVAYFSYLSNYPALAWDPIAVVDFSPIQHDMTTFDICSGISFSLGTIHKEAGTKAAKRSILMGYNRYPFSYRRQLFRAQLFYPILSKSTTYKLDSDNYYYNSLNDCMDLHIDQEIIEKRHAPFSVLSIHAVLCGKAEKQEGPNEMDQRISKPADALLLRKASESKRAYKKDAKSSIKHSILDQIAKVHQRPSEVTGYDVSEPTRKRSSSSAALSANSFLKLFCTITDFNPMPLQQTESSAPTFISGRGQTQREYPLINDNQAVDREDLSFISVPLCEIAPFNCSHLFMLKDVASDMVKYKALACEALVLACYNTASWKKSKTALSLQPKICQLSNLIHFWGDVTNMPLALGKKQSDAQSDNVYVEVIEAYSSLCSGFLSLSGSSYLSLCRASIDQDACVVNVEHDLSGKMTSSAVRYALLSQKGSRKRYRIDFIPETRSAPPVIEQYVSFLEGLNKDAMCHTISPNVDQKGVYSDILLANGEIMAKRMMDTVHMALPMVDHGAPSNVLRGLDMLKDWKEHSLKNDPACFSGLYGALPRA